MANIIGQPPPKFLLMRLNRTNQEGRAKAAKIQESLRADAQVRRPDGMVIVTPVGGCGDPDCDECRPLGFPAGYRDDTTPRH